MAIRWVLFLLVMLNILQDSKSKRAPNKQPKLNILPGRLVARFDFLKDCENVSSLAFTTTRSQITSLPNDVVVVDADLILSRTVQHMTKLIVTFHNCEDRASGKCPLFQTWRYGREFCHMIERKNQLWSPITDNINPPLKCPMLPGQYVLRNGTVDMRLMQALQFPLEQYYWRTRIEAYDATLYYCAVLGVQFLRSHHRK